MLIYVEDIPDGIYERYVPVATDDITATWKNAAGKLQWVIVQEGDSCAFDYEDGDTEIPCPHQCMDCPLNKTCASGKYWNEHYATRYPGMLIEETE